MKWIYKLDYKYGRYYIPNLLSIIAIGTFAVFFLDSLISTFTGVFISPYLSLSSLRLLQGQVWRILTFVFVHTSISPFYLMFNLYVLHVIGRNLQSYWGGFKLNLYYFMGMLGTVLGALACHFLTMAVTGAGLYGTNFHGSAFYLNLSVLLAIATIAPDQDFLFFMVIPIKGKWLLILYAVLTFIPVMQTFTRVGAFDGLTSLIMLIFSLLHYFLFFGPKLAEMLRERRRIAQNKRNWQ